MSTAPIGVLGGTFDPIHYGHLRLGEELGEALRLDEVRLLPSGTPPHRSAPAASSEHRLAMTRLAAQGNPRFRVDEREIHRSGPGYMFDTLASLRAEIGPARAIVVLLGADAFLELATWHRWRELFGLAHIAVAHRPGFPIEGWADQMPQPLAREYSARLMQQLLSVHLSPAGGIVVIPLTALDISATALRETLRSGKSARYLLPAAVLDYIRSNGLYS
ncbi:MAG: nicotinate-nucleotide adenylyltransferase [Betaproteobacteria bacterium]|nr:MAG: nicotinate-nucleotide adenylyltransferase [Betaproteobacteria bacterium SG8_41]UCF75516.1 MAG: nicotinate-nucleotide adenylyltransferase [Betaproteobacteria bacterium]